MKIMSAILLIHYIFKKKFTILYKGSYLFSIQPLQREISKHIRTDRRETGFGLLCLWMSLESYRFLKTYHISAGCKSALQARLHCNNTLLNSLSTQRNENIDRFNMSVMFKRSLKITSWNTFPEITPDTRQWSGARKAVLSCSFLPKGLPFAPWSSSNPGNIQVPHILLFIFFMPSFS